MHIFHTTHKFYRTAAKFLWKRIPSSTKSATPELALIWEVGQHLWQRDLPAVYTALAHDWSSTVKDIMKALHGISLNKLYIFC